MLIWTVDAAYQPGSDRRHGGVTHDRRQSFACCVPISDLHMSRSDGSQHTGSTRTRSAHTPHGEVEYDVVACANCGSEVMPDDAVPVAVGSETYTCDGLPFCRATHERPRETHVLCAYCAEATLGYTAEPDGVGDRLASFAADHSAVGVGLWLGVVAGVAVSAAIVVLQLLVGLV